MGSSARVPRTGRVTSLCLGALALLAVFRPPGAAAADPLSPEGFPDPLALLGPGIVDAVAKTVGLATAHRALEPATPLGTGAGLDLGLELSLSKLPEEFDEALRQAGSGGSGVPLLPVPRLNIHKGIGQRVDLGASAVWYRGYRIVGGEVKVATAVPEEGPAWAVRLAYTDCYLKLEDAFKVELSTRTLAPQVLVSRPLHFADPYLGIGYQWVLGELKLTVPLDPLPALESSAKGRGGSFVAFTGVALRAPNLGLRLTIEGAYSGAGAHALAAKAGLGF